MADRDGFAIETYAGKEVDFIACTKDDRMRERVLRGLLMKVDDSRYLVRDTRDAS